MSEASCTAVTEACDVEALKTLLNSYGCSATSEGMSRLAILLAAKHGEISLPAYAPDRSDLDNHHLAVMSEAAQASDPKGSKTKAAARVAAALRRWPASARMMETSVRSLVSRRKAETIAAFQHAERAKTLPEEFADPRTWTARAACFLFPTEQVGQALTDEAWVHHMEKAAASLPRNRSGDYQLQEAVPLGPDLSITAIRITETSQSHPHGSPRPTRDRSPVRLIASRTRTVAMPRDNITATDSPSKLFAFTSVDELLPNECTLVGDLLEWVGQVDRGTGLRIQGKRCTRDGIAWIELTATITPASDRSVISTVLAFPNGVEATDIPKSIGELASNNPTDGSDLELVAWPGVGALPEETAPIRRAEHSLPTVHSHVAFGSHL